MFPLNLASSPLHFASLNTLQYIHLDSSFLTRGFYIVTTELYGNRYYMVTTNPLGELASGYIILEGLAQDTSTYQKVASYLYHFDSQPALDLWEAGDIFTCILIARWAHGLSDKGSRWVGLILSKVGDESNTYVRKGLLISPDYEDELLGWQKRKLKIV